jgi:hypothetical protein
VKGVFESMDPIARKNFVAKANAASDRRNDLKNAAAKRNQITSPKRLSAKVVNKNKSPIKENFLLSFLHRMGYAV